MASMAVWPDAAASIMNQGASIQADGARHNRDFHEAFAMRAYNWCDSWEQMLRDFSAAVQAIAVELFSHLPSLACHSEVY